MNVSDVMTSEVITIDKDRNLKDVLHLMEQHGITKIPVTEEGKLVGIVTDGVIADKLGRAHNKNIQTATLHASSVMIKDFVMAHPDESLANLLADVGKPGLTMIPVCRGDNLVGVVTKADLLGLVKAEQPVSEFMQQELHAVGPSERLVHARRLILDHDVARLPVLDEGVVKGIIAEHEIAGAFAAFKEADPHVQRVNVRDMQVGDYMRTNVVTAGPDTSAAAAAQMMMDHQVGALPIVDDGTIKGIVTRTDLIRTVEA
ncbi:MAG: CBS domain-containing protein [Thermoplasmatota archaeon]